MLEGYLNQAPKQIPNLQKEATELAKDIISEVQADGTALPQATNGAVTPKAMSGVDSRPAIKSTDTTLPAPPK